MINFVVNIIFLECNQFDRLLIDNCFIQVFCQEDFGSESQKSQKVVEGILGFFFGFEVFFLFFFIVDEEIMRIICENKDQLQVKFLC